MAQPTQAGATHAGHYEVRCHRCNTSFALGTRRCVHCGGRLGRQARMEIPARPDALGEEEQLSGPSRAIRAMVWAISLTIALAGTLFRMCGEAG